MQTLATTLLFVIGTTTVGWAFAQLVEYINTLYTKAAKYDRLVGGHK